MVEQTTCYYRYASLTCYTLLLYLSKAWIEGLGRASDLQRSLLFVVLIKLRSIISHLEENIYNCLKLRVMTELLFIVLFAKITMVCFFFLFKNPGNYFKGTRLKRLQF